MKSKLIQGWKVNPVWLLDWKLQATWLKLFVSTVLIIGIFFRFVNIDRKVYWYDETLTSLRVFGYTKTELVDEAFKGKVITVADLQQYQHPSPDKSLSDTITALSGNAEHPPLYYLMARLWAEWFGSSVAAMRSLAAVISLLAFPCIYWLSLELFGSSLVGWIAIGLLAVSPFHVLYAQEAREYSLWTVTILFSSASLLRAIRLQNKLNWGLYAVSVALGIYSQLIAVLVSIGHGIYLILNKSLRTSKILKSYLGASILGFLAFTPWLLIVVINLLKIHETIAGSRKDLSFSSLIDKWFLNFNRLFLDHELGALNLIFVILAIYSIYFLCRKTPQLVWSFVLTLIGVTALTLVVPDLVSGGRRSTIMRYVAPCCLGIQLAVAYFLANQISSTKIWQQRLGRTLVALLVTAGIIGCTISSQAEVWWTKSRTRTGHYPELARLINQANHPLIVSNSGAIGLLSLSHLLDATVRFQLVVDSDMPQIPDTDGDLFLLDPSDGLIKRVERQENSQIEPVFQWKGNTHLWKVEKQ
ncbi:glycosyltransferase family 39 protein [Lyngbya aestuarii]|uniref:glycosyltransferase family 39 protein n=1 Tax=Lyngbya aestuarii TaxID=118322 RepID=UPI00403E055B